GGRQAAAHRRAQRGPGGRIPGGDHVCPVRRLGQGSLSAATVTVLLRRGHRRAGARAVPGPQNRRPRRAAGGAAEAGAADRGRSADAAERPGRRDADDRGLQGAGAAGRGVRRHRPRLAAGGANYRRDQPPGGSRHDPHGLEL
ncbi:MAG: Ferritin Dps family protein, partial [uncultured Thermomicrobiales bacterium]